MTSILDQQGNQVVENAGNPSHPRPAPKGGAEPTTQPA
jgi:hypothetical protein